MDNREIRAAADRADWQITLGVTAAVGLVAWRFFAVFLLALSEPPNYLSAAGALFEATVCAVLAWRVQRGSGVAASLLFIIWAVGFAYSWISSDSGLPPFALISALIAIGLAQGIIGTVARERIRSSASTPLPNER